MLARMSAFWFQATSALIENHFIAMADDPKEVGEYEGVFPGNWKSTVAALSPEIARQSMVVRKAQRIDVECIVRGYLAGSAYVEYQRTGTLWGRKLPQGIKEGDPLQEPAFTPTTKAEEGHDQPISYQEMADVVGQDVAHKLEETSLALYTFAHEYARQRGIILADTKMEFGFLDGRLILIDELSHPRLQPLLGRRRIRAGPFTSQLRQTVR